MRRLLGACFVALACLVLAGCLIGSEAAFAAAWSVQRGPKPAGSKNVSTSERFVHLERRLHRCWLLCTCGDAGRRPSDGAHRALEWLQVVDSTDS